MIKGSIILVPFPFDDFSVSKVRPALCLTNTIGKYDHIVIAFISSRIPEDLNNSDYVIIKGSENSSKTGLTVDSVIRLHKIITIPKSVIKRKLGVINNSVEGNIKTKLWNLLVSKIVKTMHFSASRFSF